MSNQLKSSLAEIQKGDTVISYRAGTFGAHLSKQVVTHTTKTQIHLGDRVYRRKDGKRVGEQSSAEIKAPLAAYYIDRLTNAIVTWLEALENREAEQRDKAHRNANLQWIRDNMGKLNHANLEEIVTEMKRKIDLQILTVQP